MIDQYLVAALDKNSVIDVFIVRLGEKLAPNYADIVLFTKHANKLSLAKVTERSIGALGFQVCFGHDVLESLGEVAHVFGVVDFVGSVQQVIHHRFGDREYFCVGHVGKLRHFFSLRAYLSASFAGVSVRLEEQSAVCSRRGMLPVNMLLGHSLIIGVGDAKRAHRCGIDRLFPASISR